MVYRTRRFKDGFTRWESMEEVGVPYDREALVLRPETNVDHSGVNCELDHYRLGTI